MIDEIRAGAADTASPDRPDDLFLRVWAVYEAGGVLAACAWCERVRIDGAWLVPPRAALAAIDARHVLSHSICDECAEAARVATGAAPFERAQVPSSLTAPAPHRAPRAPRRRVLEDASGRRLRAMRWMGRRTAALLLLVWLAIVILGGLGAGPASDLPFARSGASALPR